MEFWGITDIGKIRKQNQDIYRMLSNEKEDIAVLVVCDGMGGANAGNIAGELAVNAFIEYITDKMEEIESLTDNHEIAEIMTAAVLTANTVVFDKSLQGDEFAGMGTTLTAAISSKYGEVVANVGDSRLYLVTKSKITQITRDHSVVEDMIERGEITRSEARRHPNRNLITRALGTCIYEPPDIFFLNLAGGDFIILCSDGLTDVVLDSEIQFELNNGDSVRDSCEVLVKMALARGAPDNVTLVVLMK